MTDFSAIAHESFAELNVQRSRFYSHVFEIDSVSQAREKIKALSRSYSDATHLCWALRVIETELIELSSDGGEPSGTAGFPILNVLRENNLVNLCCVVIRYFGGVKLGIRGLIDAYSQAARLALAKTEIVEIKRVFEHVFECKYGELGTLLGMIRKLGGKIEKIEQSDRVIVRALLPQKIDQFHAQVREKLVKMI